MLQADSANTERKVEWPKGLVSEAKKARKYALNNVASSHERVMVTGTCEAESLFNSSVASSQMTKGTAELCQTRDMILTQSKEIPKVAQLKSYKKTWRIAWHFRSE